MIPNQHSFNIALSCDSTGIIRNVLSDTIGIPALQPGNSLGQVVTPGSRIKLFNFLVELRLKGLTFDWEIDLVIGQDILTMHFAGVMNNNQLIIIGAHTHLDALNLWEEMMRINNDQATAMRSLTKDLVHLSTGQSVSDIDLYNQISHLNNELITLQRDLSKKNAELERLYSEVQHMAITDPLTGIHNRRGFFELGMREYERSKRFEHPLAIIMFDLDHFKNINDTFGHAFGDLVLKEVCNRCREKLRQVDIFGRYGGEEFCILLPETAMNNAANVAERLRLVVAQPFRLEDRQITITISLGVTVMKNEDSAFDAMLNRADIALFKAKAAGRNCFFVQE